MYAQMVNNRFTVQEETVENRRTRQERNNVEVVCDRAITTIRLNEEIIQTAQQTKEKRSRLEPRQVAIAHSRPLRMHRQTESAQRVAKVALDSNTQDVTQDGVHVAVRQGTG